MAGRGLVSVLLLLAFAALAVTFLPSLFGYERYVLVGSSMEPTIHRGSLVFDEIVPVRSCARATSSPTSRPAAPAGDAPDHLGQAPEAAAGPPVFRTQGDNVAKPDMRAFTLDKPTQARYSFAVPYLGWLYVALGTPQLRLILLVAPALLIALSMLARLWREGGRLAAERAKLAPPSTRRHEMRGPGQRSRL